MISVGPEPCPRPGCGWSASILLVGEGCWVGSGPIDYGAGCRRGSTSVSPSLCRNPAVACSSGEDSVLECWARREESRRAWRWLQLSARALSSRASRAIAHRRRWRKLKRSRPVLKELGIGIALSFVFVVIMIL